MLTREEKQLGLLLTPSATSALLAVVASLFINAGTVILLAYRGSTWQYLAQLQAERQRTIGTSYHVVDTSFSANVLINNIPLFIFWAGVGLIVYSFTMGIVRAFRSAVDLHEEMDYVNVDRRFLLRDALEHLGLRVVAFIVWIWLVSYTVHAVVPYIVAVASVSVGADSFLLSVLYLLWGIVLGVLVAHLHTVLIRLLFVKARLFNEA